MDARGNVTSETFGNGATTNRTYNRLTSLLESINGTKGRASIQNLAYAWDTVGNLTSRSEKSDGKNLRETFRYDQLNRLSQSQVRYNNVAQTAQVVRYDAIGNITSKTGVHSKYQYGDTNAGPHALTSNGGCKTYAYDANGNQTSFRNCTSTEYSPQYSTFDKATVVTRNNHKSEFAYGPNRARYQRIDYIKQSGRFEKRKTTWYLGSVELIDHQTSIGTVSKREYRRNMGGVIQTIS